MGTTHLALAAAMFLSLKEFGLSVGVDLVFVAVLVGSIFPDIDHPRSSIARQSFLTQGISRVASSVSEHRGIFHSLVASIILTLPLYAILSYSGLAVAPALGFWFGYLAHLVGDSATRGGVKWLQPFSDWKLKGPVRTGSVTEELIFVLLLAIVFYFLLL